MINPVLPALPFFLGALLVPLLRGRVQSLFLLLVPVVSFINLVSLPQGALWHIDFLGLELLPCHIDSFSLVWGYIFHLIAFLGGIYILNIKTRLECSSALAYTGAALGVVFSGDFFSFFVFWEMLTFGALFLIFPRGTKASFGAAMRYLYMHVAGGLVLLAGVLLLVYEQWPLAGPLTVEHLGLSSPATYLIFLGFGVNSAWPLLHTWLTDSYPEATVGGAVFLSALTTKTAVYAIARVFAGEPALLWIGGAMAALPIFYAVIENDLRRVLGYSLINQVGFMICGIGLGTALSLNGTAAHVFTHILYKALLFMSIGAVLYRTGKSKATELGGLYKSMPFTCLCCIVGAASISAFPLFSGFVSKSMVMTAAAEEHQLILWFVLLFASAGVFHHAGIKIPFFAFFSHDSGIRVKEAPLSMCIAMGITAALCIGIGMYPQATLYQFLPFTGVGYEPYTAHHVLAQSQLLFFSALAFCLLLLSGIYPAEIRATNLDFDWVYRRGMSALYRLVDTAGNGLNQAADQLFMKTLIPKVNNFFETAPAHVAAFLLTPYWTIKTSSPEQRHGERERLYRKFTVDAFRVGVSTACSLIFLLVLFLVH